MNKRTLIHTLVSSFAIFGFWLMIQPSQINAQENSPEGQYASVNGLEIYYQTTGEGQPLILLHGGLGGAVEFSQLIPLMAENRQVIAVELQGHGHTADIDRPLSYELMADDVAALIEALGFENADVMGFSLGGGVALQTAIRHPEVVRKLVLISTPYQQAGIHDEFLAGMTSMNADAAAMMLDTPMYQFYASVAPNVDNWSTLVGKAGALLAQDYDWTDDVAQMTTPTLILAGDSDMIYPEQAVSMFDLLGGGVAGDFLGFPASQLALLPATSHFTILSRSDLLLPIITPFLDAPLAEVQ